MKKLRNLIKQCFSPVYWPHLEAISLHMRCLRYLFFGRPVTRCETYKAHARRLREGFFEKYCRGRGLDIGYGGDLIVPDAEGFEIEHGDAGRLPGVQRGVYDFVSASHLLEHMCSPESALKTWWECVRPGGVLILFVPHRDLYEKRTTLPSRWNPDHKWFFLPECDDPPHTLGVLPLLRRSLQDSQIEVMRVCDDGHSITDPERHSDGEYSIEVVIRKQTFQ